MTSLYVFVTGSRNATLGSHCIFVRDTLLDILDLPPTDERGLVHGCCHGIDLLAATVARDLDWGSVMGIPARWSELGKSAGPTRNRLLVDMSVLLRDSGYRVLWMAFPQRDSVGTWNCVRQAKDAGFHPSIHPLSENRS